jgi:hypothetical protein
MYNSVVNLHVRILNANEHQAQISACIDEYNLVTSSHSDVYQGCINKGRHTKEMARIFI